MSDVMVERWRKPIRVTEIDDDVIGVFTSPDGRQWYRPVFVLESKDDYDRLRLGYACGICLEVFERPFPDECCVCGFNVKRDQMVLLDSELKGQHRPLEIKSGETVIDTKIDARSGHRETRIWTPENRLI